MRQILVWVLLSGSATVAYAETAIDLSCDKMAATIVQRLDKEGLLVPFDDGKQRATAIAMSMCAEQQRTAQQQHEQDKKDFITNWLTENTGGKPGNDRLRNLKR